MSRGDRREHIVRDDVDRQDSLETSAETCQKAFSGACLWPDGQSLSSGGGNAGGKLGGGNALAPEPRTPSGAITGTV